MASCYNALVCGVWSAHVIALHLLVSFFQKTKHGDSAEFIKTLQRLNKYPQRSHVAQQGAMDSLKKLVDSIKAKKLQ